jgi:hypothetical protein
MSRRRLLRVSGAALLTLTADEAARFGGVGPADAWWVEVVAATDSTMLVARRARTPVVAQRRHLAGPNEDAGGGETDTERRRLGLRQRLVQLGDKWALPLSAEHLDALGVGETETAVLVRMENGDPPRLVIRRAPTFDEAVESTLLEHGEALRQLATVPAVPDV